MLRVYREETEAQRSCITWLSSHSKEENESQMQLVLEHCLTISRPRSV